MTALAKVHFTALLLHEACPTVIHTSLIAESRETEFILQPYRSAKEWVW